MEVVLACRNQMSNDFNTVTKENLKPVLTSWSTGRHHLKKENTYILKTYICQQDNVKQLQVYTRALENHDY